MTANTEATLDGMFTSKIGMWYIICRVFIYNNKKVIKAGHESNPNKNAAMKTDFASLDICYADSYVKLS